MTNERRCKNCGKYLARGKVSFCNDKCEKAYEVFTKSDNEYLIGACQDVVEKALVHAFIYKSEESEKIDGAFVMSNLVGAWCDCSRNFVQDRLIKNYQEAPIRKSTERKRLSQLMLS